MLFIIDLMIPHNGMNSIKITKLSAWLLLLYLIKNFNKEGYFAW